MFGVVKQSPLLQLHLRRQLISVAKIGGAIPPSCAHHQDCVKTKDSHTLSPRRGAIYSAPFDVNKRDMATAAGPSKGTKNRLELERSPYLLQHASNPVDWYPWGPEAFERSKKENKPIFLSVGYSTCHWCHVMERESFESEEIAAVLNKNYISIKVDREERPDVDRIYMSFVQRTTGSGGWPMSVFLTPELEPLFGGTYFPPQDMYHRIGFKSLLEMIAKQWKEQSKVLKEEAKSSALQLKQLVSLKLVRNAPVPGDASWDKCYQQILSSYDSENGGFSDAPKFPQPIMFNFLFHMYSKNQKTLDGAKALEMCLHSLKKMAYGGIHDHVNTGFARYSVDELWHLPHFEKMLYDQGQLAVSYTDAYVVSRDQFFAETVDDILNYVNRDLGHKMGGFYGAEDADSYPLADSTSKKEGAFCVWEYDEIKSLLTEKTNGVSDFEVYAQHFNVRSKGNVPRRYDQHNELVKKNVLGCTGSYEDTAAHFKLPVETVKEILAKCHKILYVERQKRPKPHVDTKIVTAWNGLMISGFAKAGFALKNEGYTQRAVDAANFIRTHLYKDKRLLRCCYGETHGDIRFTEQLIYGFLDDYAFIIRGLIDLYEATLDSSWLEFAEVLQDRQDKEFWDSQGSGYFTSYSDSNVIIRDKEDHDGAEPCGNSVAVHNLLRLASYLNRKDFKEKAASTLSAYSERLLKVPVALPEMTSALMSYHTEPTQIFIVGSMDDEHTQLLVDEVRKSFIPGRQVALLDGPDGRSKILYKRNEILAKLKPVQGKSAVYVCRNLACVLPITDPELLGKSLKSGGVLLTSDSSSSD